MDFYHTPGSSSQSAHIVLHEAKVRFRPHKVDIFSHTLEDGSDYGLVNPNGYVPALTLADGTLLTENVAIIDWLASGPADLLPDGALGRTRHLQMLAFISTEVQKPFIPLFFIDDQVERTRLRRSLAERFRWVGSKVEGDFLFGDRFSGADAFLYVMLRWAAMSEVETPPSLNGLAARIENRGSVRAVLAAEGFDPMAGADLPR